MDLVDQRQEEGGKIYRCQLLQNLDKALQISGLQLCLHTQGALPDHLLPDLEGQAVLENLAVQQISLEQVPDRGRVEQQEKSLLQLRQSPELLVTGGHLVDSEQALCQFNLVTDSFYSCSQLLTFQVVAQQLFTGGAKSAPLLFNQPIRMVTQYSPVFFQPKRFAKILIGLDSSNLIIK